MRRLVVAALLALGCRQSEASDQREPPSPTLPPSGSGSATASVAPETPSSAPAPVPAPAAEAGMVLVPGGFFLMGAYRARGNPEERPAHEVVMPSYLLDE